MNQNKPHFKIGLMTPKKRRGVAEVISTLLLVVVTVAGAVILTGFLDESFVSGGLSVVSSTDTTIKTIKLLAYDTRDGDDLMGYSTLDNNVSNLELCGISCNGNPNTTPASGGSEFLVLQVENRSVDTIFLKAIYLDKIHHVYDQETMGQDLDGGTVPLSNGAYPKDGKFSILSGEVDSNGNPVDTEQLTNEILGGQTRNIVIKLDSDLTSHDIALSKTIQVQLNIGENSLAEFLIESGDTR